MRFRGSYPYPLNRRVVPPGADPFRDVRPLDPIEPPRGGSMSDIAQHGQTRDLSQGQQVSVLRWRSADSGVEQVSLLLGIVLKQSLVSNDIPVGQPTPIVQAELRWGIGGATHTAVVDYRLGAEVALAAS